MGWRTVYDDCQWYMGHLCMAQSGKCSGEAARHIAAYVHTGILHQMQKERPDKTFIPAPPENNCACNDCPHMKLNTLEKLYLCMKYEQPEIVMDEVLRVAAKKPIDRMMQMSRQLGLEG